jgi:hypothetical protein
MAILSRFNSVNALRDALHSKASVPSCKASRRAKIVSPWLPWSTTVAVIS